MYLYTLGQRKLVEATLDGSDIRAFRKAMGWSIREMAEALWLDHRSSLLQYEVGSKPLSRIVRRRFLRLARGNVYNAVLFAVNGEVVPERTVISGRVKACECGCNEFFLRMTRKKQFVDRQHQLNARGKRRKNA